MPDATNLADQQVVNAIVRKFKTSLSLSITVFILCIGSSIWGVIYVQQQQIAEQQVTKQACEQQVIQYNQKAIAIHGFASPIVTLDECKSNVQTAITDAKNNYNSAQQEQVQR